MIKMGNRTDSEINLDCSDLTISNVGHDTGENIMVVHEKCLDYREILRLFLHSFGLVNEDNHPDQEKYIHSQYKRN